MDSRKIAFSGSHGTGKTTSVFRVSHEYKMSHPELTVCPFNEVARECPMSINLKSTFESQMWIFTNQIAKEIEFCNRYDLVVCDRTVIDCLAYCKVFGMNALFEMLYHTGEDWVRTYDSIYFNTIEKNPYNFEDGKRMDSGEGVGEGNLIICSGNDIRQQVEKELLSIYDDMDVDLIMQ